MQRRNSGRTQTFKPVKRIPRMNKHVEGEVGEDVAEKRSWRWAFTGFVREDWGENEKEFDT